MLYIGQNRNAISKCAEASVIAGKEMGLEVSDDKTK
jgi:hypothetical protein